MIDQRFISNGYALSGKSFKVFVNGQRFYHFTACSGSDGVTYAQTKSGNGAALPYGTTRGEYQADPFKLDGLGGPVEQLIKYICKGARSYEGIKMDIVCEGTETDASEYMSLAVFGCTIVRREVSIDPKSNEPVVSGITFQPKYYAYNGRTAIDLQRLT